MVEELLRRIVKKYAALKRRCEQKKCLLALSVAWALAGEAAGGNEAVFEHIDESIHARQSMDGQYLLPSASLMGCYPIMVQGDPFVFDSEGTTMEMIMWDFYAVLIEHAWAPGTIGQFFYIYALADTEHVAFAAPIISSYCAASVLWSRIFLKEKLSLKHYASILLVVAGIVILGILDI